jgi:ketosteroid isomerase-like protein
VELDTRPSLSGTTADPLAIVDAFGAAWGAHDLDATMALTTVDCVFESTEPGPDGTRYEGRAAIRTAWQPIFEDAHADFQAEESFAAGDRVVQRWRYSWAGGHIRGVDVFRIRDGLVSEKLSYVKG